MSKKSIPLQWSNSTKAPLILSSDYPIPNAPQAARANGKGKWQGNGTHGTTAYPEKESAAPFIRSATSNQHMLALLGLKLPPKTLR
ncbi:hypothetical protein [Sutterella wadsworthensis]|uniref:hypothetical protein n=1 Tax=Sutterella wadsworthensis TaxID=40545 RepID=UPI002672120A|nr:hypothetical protein [Sutterella wadsworthensis]